MRTGMGAWGPGIFEDDVAMDVRGMLEEALDQGWDLERATRRVLDEMADALDDMDDGPVIYLALAALQLERGTVLERIRNRALEIIARDAGLERWADTGGETLDARRRVLDDLRKSLEESRD